MTQGRRVKPEAEPRITEDAQKEAAGIAAGNLRRYEGMQQQFYWGGVLCFWVLLLCGMSLALVCMWHLVAPDHWRFLTAAQESELQRVLIAALGSSALTGYAKKLTRSPKG